MKYNDKKNKRVNQLGWVRVGWLSLFFFFFLWSWPTIKEFTTQGKRLFSLGRKLFTLRLVPFHTPTTRGQEYSIKKKFLKIILRYRNVIKVFSCAPNCVFLLVNYNAIHFAWCANLDMSSAVCFALTGRHTATSSSTATFLKLQADGKDGKDDNCSNINQLHTPTLMAELISTAVARS